MKKIFIGIDFSKEKFDATLIKSEGLKECAPSVHEVFNNKTSGFRRLVTWVKAQSESAPIDSWLFCGENTGGYKYWSKQLPLCLCLRHVAGVCL